LDISYDSFIRTTDKRHEVCIIAVISCKMCLTHQLCYLIPSFHTTYLTQAMSLMHTEPLFACTTGHCTLRCTHFDINTCAKVSADLCLSWDIADSLSDCVNLHQVLVEQLLQRVWDKGDIYKAKYEGEDTPTNSMNNSVLHKFLLLQQRNQYCVPSCPHSSL